MSRHVAGYSNLPAGRTGRSVSEMEVTVPRPPVRRYDSVLCDLLTALLDSWTLWNEVAGDAAAGRRWRARYLELTYATGAYRPYEALVAEAAVACGLDGGLGEALAARYAELRPWPGVVNALRPLVAAGVKLGVATNCSEKLGRSPRRVSGCPSTWW